MQRPLVLVTVFTVPALAGAQTYVVDRSNGAGTHFTDLPQATATVPDGAVLLVRPGT